MPSRPVEGALDHPHRDRLAARLGPEQQATDAQPPADRHNRAEKLYGHRAAEGQPVRGHVAAASQVQDPPTRSEARMAALNPPTFTTPVAVPATVRPL
jgi:hypothetical protein